MSERPSESSSPLSRASSPRFALKSSKACLPAGLQPAVIIVDGERIESIVSPSQFSDDIPCEDFGDLVLSPGVVDTHVHINEPGTDWEGFLTATSAAAAGGVTTLIDMPLNSLPVTTTAAALRAKQEAAALSCRIDVGFYGGVVPNNSDEITKLVSGGVFGIKSFLCNSGLPEFPATSASDLREILPRLKGTGVPLLVHAELVDQSLAATVTDNCSYVEYLLSRPAKWETDAIEMLIKLCRKFQTPIHVVHVATSSAAKLIDDAQKDQLPISFETCPHYLYFHAEQIKSGDTRFKCAPPIRMRSNNEKLWSMLCNGQIDTIGSDHSPCPPDMKSMETGVFRDAWGGIAGLQFSLPVIATLARSRGVKVEEITKWLSVNPARIVGLENRKGQLLAGLDADIVVWDPEAEFTVKPKDVFHRHKLTPYTGERLFGRVRRTYLRGNLVFQNGNQIGDSVGQLLRRPRCDSR